MNILNFIDNLDEEKVEKKKQGFHVDMESETIKNDYFRKVLHTALQLQLVVMSLKPNEDIGLETHDDDQFIRVDKGNGKAIIGDKEFKLKDGSAIIIPGGVSHNITAGKTGIKLYTVYASNHHPDGAIHKNKKEAVEAEKDEE